MLDEKCCCRRRIIVASIPVLALLTAFNSAHADDLLNNDVKIAIGGYTLSRYDILDVTYG